MSRFGLTQATQRNYPPASIYSTRNLPTDFKELLYRQMLADGVVRDQIDFEAKYKNGLIESKYMDYYNYGATKDNTKSTIARAEEALKSSYVISGCEKKLQNLEKFSYSFIAFLTIATGIILCTTLGYSTSVSQGVKIFMVTAGVIAILTAIGELWYIFVKKDTVKYNVLAIINLIVYFLCIVSAGIAYYDLTISDKETREGIELITTGLVLSSVGLVMNFAFSFFIVLYKV